MPLLPVVVELPGANLQAANILPRITRATIGLARRVQKRLPLLFMSLGVHICFSFKRISFTLLEKHHLVEEMNKLLVSRTRI